MRLVDADTLQEEYKKENGGKRLLLIDVAPTADVIEVVRCKDCKHRRYEAPPNIYFCMADGHNGHNIKANLMGFCSDADRAD